MFSIVSRSSSPQSAAIKVGIIQGNVPTRIKLSEDGLRRAVTGYVGGYEQLAAQGSGCSADSRGGAADAVGQSQQSVLSGGAEDENPSLAGHLCAGGGWDYPKFADDRPQLAKFSAATTRSSWFPWANLFPFKEVLGNLVGRLSSIRFGMIPGTAAQRFDTPFGRAIASICYESAFPELFRAQAADGGQFILTVSNLDPYSEVLMAQHQAQDVIRAIETDRWAARATNTGYSGVLNPHGQVIWRSQPQVYEAHAATIYRRQTQTLYVRWGDWLMRLMLGLSAIVVGYAQFINRRSRVG